MEWREQSAVSCEAAFMEAQRWLEEVTKKKFGNKNFRSALENGVLLCDLINRIKPGIIRRVNRLSTPIAGLDNINVFLKACVKLGLKEAQLFHPGDLQDLSTRVTVKQEETSRRLKNVLITIYWLGRKAHSDTFYNGPYLNLRAFEGLIGTALSKALEDTSSFRGFVRDSGFGDGWYTEKDELFPLSSAHRREDSLDSLDSVGSRTLSISSDTTLKGSSEGCCSDAEGELGFKMSDIRDTLQYRRSMLVEPRTATQFNQFLPSRDKPAGYVPAPLRKKRAERNEDNRRSWASPMYTEEDGTFTREDHLKVGPDPYNSSPAFTLLQWQYDYESESDTDSERPEPDVVLDDLAGRRFRSSCPALPVNYAVPITRRYHRIEPVKTPIHNLSCLSENKLPESIRCVPSSSTAPPLPTNPRAAVQSDIYDWEEDEENEEGYADPVQDDLYARKLGLTLKSSGSASYDRFLPKHWTPEEDVHVGRIQLGSQRRPWYRKMQGFSHTKSGSSSEESDCDMSPWLVTAPRPQHQPDTAHKGPAGSLLNQPQRNESPCDIPEETSLLSKVRYEDMQRMRNRIKESEDKWQDDLTKWKNRRRSVNSDIDKKKEERKHTGLITSDTGNSWRSRSIKEGREDRENRVPAQHSNNINRQEILSTPESTVFTRDLPDRSNTHSALLGSDTIPPPSPSTSAPTSPSSEDKAIAQAPSRYNPNHLLYKPISMDTKGGEARVSASLPRSIQGSATSRLTSVVTPRPFGTQATRVASLPRTFTMENDSQKQSNRDMERAEKTAVPSRYSQFVTSEDESRSQSSSVQSSNEDEEEEAEVSVLQHNRAPVHNSAPQSNNVQELHSDMRISLNQKPNSSRDFGFQTEWDSTGAHIKTVQPGSPAEHCQLKEGDEVLAVGGRPVSEMSYDEWKASMADALQHGSLVMDIRHHGKNSAQGQHNSSPGDLGTRLAVDPHPLTSKPTYDLASKGMNGSLRDDAVTMQNKECESISLRNLKRRSEFFEQQGGSDSPISNLPVPTITMPSSRWSWDPEEERKRQEKWQREQERLLQEKYKRDQEKLEQEWHRAQQEAFSGEGYVEAQNPYILRTQPPPLIQPAPSAQVGVETEAVPTKCQEEEEDVKHSRYEEELKKAEEQLGLEKVEEQQQEDEQKSPQHAEEQQKKSEKQQEQWPGEFHEFGKGFSENFISDRARSKSTPELDDVDKPQDKSVRTSVGEPSWCRDPQKKKRTTMPSQAELERQQILEEMKKKTQLLTDSSWIRQRSTSVHKEPTSLPGPIRRGESLDNLDSACSWRPTSWTSGTNYTQPQSTFGSSSSLGYRRSGSALPSSSSTGSLKQGPWSLRSPSSPNPQAVSEEHIPESQPPSQQRSRSISGRKICTFCETPLGKGAAMIIESLGLCYHLGCFKCISCSSDLARSESGAEVRIRNQQLYCNACYLRFRTGQPTPM